MSGAGTSPYAGTTPVAPLGPRTGVVTLVEGQSFAVSDRSGDMAPDTPHGLFVFDTRVLSWWELRIDGHRVEPLVADTPTPFSATFVAHARPAPGHADADVVVFRHRHVGRGMRERLVVSNHGLGRAEVEVEVLCDVDFADLFSVKEGRVHPGAAPEVTVGDRELTFTRRDGSMTRQVRVRGSGAPEVRPRSLVWPVPVEPGEQVELCIEVTAAIDGLFATPMFTCGGNDPETVPHQRMASWRASLPDIGTSDPALAETVARTETDLGALRIFDPDNPDVPILAAGAPWFMTVFGRDSLLTAWMTLIADTSLAQGVLRTLARFQGREVNPAIEEEPGKILHEMRFDQSSVLALGGGSIYYGSIDATPLFVMLLGELRRWDARDPVVDELLPHADRALEWIEAFGDRDGDGYVEYLRSDEHGLANQAWKDSWDAVRHADGRLAEAPLALCEVQGYVYAAYVARAELARDAGDLATAERFQRRAEELRRRFNEDFWIDRHGWFALALDRDKRPVDVLASNMGHCLWTGIVDPDRAAIVAERLLSPDMFSGFGVRTLARSATAYNPVSYHNGSVWPHDNALCAAGLARYGFVEEAQRIVTAQLDVARHHAGRLPELFAGFDRDELPVPAPYPTSCSPQAWAAAAPLLWLRTLLRLDPCATDGTLWLDPHLPTAIRHLSVEGIRVGGASLTVTVDGDEVTVEGAGDLRVCREPRPLQRD